MPNIQGIVPAMVTPFQADERIDFGAWQRLIDTLIAAGVDGIFCGGSSGEFFALDREEREASLRFCRQAAAHRVPVYSNVGCITTRDTVALARVAEAEGIDVLVVITPYYVKPSQQELAEHYIEVCRAVRAPVLAYNYPAHGGAQLEPETLGLIGERCENLVGIKNSSGVFDLSLAYRDCVPGRKLSVLVGFESQTVPALENGLAGCVTALSNLAPRLFVELYRAYREGRRGEVDRLQAIVNSMWSWVLAHTFPSTLKEAMGMAGLPVGPCRRPIGAIPAEVRAALIAGIQNLREEGYLHEPTGRGAESLSSPARA